MSRQKVGQSQNGAVYHIGRDDLCDQILKKKCIFSTKVIFWKFWKEKKKSLKMI